MLVSFDCQLDTTQSDRGREFQLSRLAWPVGVSVGGLTVMVDIGGLNRLWTALFLGLGSWTT